jgi:hypothetical protein
LNTMPMVNRCILQLSLSQPKSISKFFSKVLPKLN